MRWSNRMVLAALGGVVIAAGGALAVWDAQYQADRESRRRAAALTGGEPELARAHILRYGCAGCHDIPGIAAPDAVVGPPLGEMGKRVYIAGVITNTPPNLVRWIIDPPSIDPMTAMPATGINEAEARDVAANLYSLR